MKKKVMLINRGGESSLCGKYKGYDIIRLIVGGKTIKSTDAPAISFNSRTMIPIYMLKEAGVNYSWDQETRTVDIKKSSSSNTSYVKFLYTLTEHFDTLQAIDKDLDLSEDKNIHP